MTTQEPLADLHLFRSLHPGAKTLRRLGVLLLVFTVPTVLALTGGIPDPLGPDAPGWKIGVTMGWFLIGIFGPIMMLWFGSKGIGDYLQHFPNVRRSVAVLMLLAGLGMLGFGVMLLGDPTVRGRKGAPLVLGIIVLGGGIRLLKGTQPKS